MTGTAVRLVIAMETFTRNFRTQKKRELAAKPSFRLLSILVGSLLVGCISADLQRQEDFRAAINNNDIRTAAAKLREGADVNGHDEAERTALSDAAATDHPEIVRFLLHHGAATQGKDLDGKSAFDYAHDPVIRKMLLEASSRP